MRKQIFGAVAAMLILESITGCSSQQNTQVESMEDTEATSQSTQEETEEESTGEVDIYEGIKTGKINAYVSVHDPSIIVENGIYYIFGSHMASAKSENLRTWDYIGNGYNSNNAVYTDLWADDSHVFDYAGDYGNGSYAVWAPDVIYNEAMGKYVMYYCTSSTYIKSNLCYATSDSIEGPYTWQGAILYSGFTEDELDQTDVCDYVIADYAKETYLNGNGDYNNLVAPNCIDPTVFYDADGKMWMVYGSWSGGIFLLEIDEQTGLPIHPEADEENKVDPYFGKLLMGGGHQSMEAPYILYDANSGYYYLFVSYGSLEREGGYQIRVFRSENPDGPYVDMNDSYPETGTNNAYYGLKLSGNYNLPSLTCAYMATGHNSAFIDEDGKMYVVYHTRFDEGTEYHEPRVKQMFLNEEGWPVILPYATDGETISDTGYDTSELVGTYYFINQGMKIDSAIAEPTLIELKEDGTVTGTDENGASFEGTWSVTDGTAYMKFSYGKIDYSGVFCEQNDEAGTPVMVFTAAGKNRSIWGVKYVK